MTVWARDDVRQAFSRLITRRDDELARGERSLGWKLGFGTPAALASLELEQPLIGYLLERGQLPSGATVGLSDWTAPRVETEIALYLGANLAAGSSREQCGAAIAEMSLAFELIDVTLDGPTAPALLDRNIYQRGVVLGDRHPFSTPPPVTLTVNGQERISATDPSVNVGDLLALTTHVADVLDTLGAGLMAGDVIITGAIEPALAVSPGEHHAAAAPGLGEVSLRFT